MSLFDYSCDLASELAALDWRKVNVPQILLAAMAADMDEDIDDSLDRMGAETAHAHYLMCELELADTATPEQYWRAQGFAV